MREAGINVDSLLSPEELDKLSRSVDKKPPHAVLPEEEEEEIPVHGSEGG